MYVFVNEWERKTERHREKDRETEKQRGKEKDREEWICCRLEKNEYLAYICTYIYIYVYINICTYIIEGKVDH